MSPADNPPITPALAVFQQQVLNPFKLRLFMLRKLPMAWLAGLRLAALTPAGATVTVPFKYLTQNPFRSIYFACLAMAAELASGMLAMLHTQGGGPVSMLVVGLEADFSKKAVGLISFVCDDGAAIARAVADSTGRTIGGHLLDGCRIYTTAEIVLGELPALEFGRETDATFGYKELSIRPRVPKTGKSH